MLSQDELKKNVATAAIEYLLPRLSPTTILGIGTGSTIDYFIHLLAAYKSCFAAAVSSSSRSTQALQQQGIPVLDLNDVSQLGIYIDGADEISYELAMIKGGGGALTQEKIVASQAQEFLCIVDESKLVDQLGAFPLPVEVIPLARQAVARQLAAMGGNPVWRQGFVSDNGGHILDVAGFQCNLPQAQSLEGMINNIPGVISCGFFALKPADYALVACQTGIKHLSAQK